MKYIKSILVIFCVALLFAACEKACTHQYESRITVQASCTAEGEEVFTCTLCQHSYTQKISAQSHNYGTEAVEKEPTCSEEGLRKRNCTACGATESEPIEKLPHTLLDGVTVTKEPNCTQKGEGIGVCGVCGADQVPAELPTNDTHVFTETVVREATCTEAGEGMKTCTLCQYAEPCQYDKKAHAYNTQNVTIKATCTQNGEQQKICADCGHTAKEVVAALGHSWSAATCQEESKCTRCNVSNGKGKHAFTILSSREASDIFAGYRQQKCNVCGYENTEYYTKAVTIDLAVVDQTLVEYAKSLGFSAHIEKHDQPRYRFTISVGQTMILGYGQESLIKKGKNFIDQYYAELKDSPVDLSVYMIQIHTYYTQSAAIGMGYFGVYVSRTFA